MGGIESPASSRIHTKCVAQHERPQPWKEHSTSAAAPVLAITGLGIRAHHIPAATHSLTRTLSPLHGSTAPAAPATRSVLAT
ncbi:unnamed protein product, partial [Closterium sp. Naga37s-1]